MTKKSPFPGMDPFIEVNPRWSVFHSWFIRKLAEQTFPIAQQAGLWIDVERSVYQREPAGELVLIGEPDAMVGPDFSTPSWEPSQNGAAVALAEPTVIHEVVLDPELLERHKQDFLVIREMDQFNRVIAVVELLSPANKSGTYAGKYREKRQRLLTSRSHFMEIDFLRGGENPSRAMFPELDPTPYFIFVARKTGLGRNEEGYPLRLQDPLPTIGLPVGPKRADLPLNLAEAFESAFALSIRTGLIRYSEEPVPEPPLPPDDTAWVRSIVSNIH